MSGNPSSNTKELSKTSGHDKITVQQEKFCHIYATQAEFFGNGVQSYAVAYNINLNKRGGYMVAQAGAARLLAKPKILKRIDELLAVHLNDVHVDKQLAFWITQKVNAQAAVSAIKEYNNLKKRTEGAKNINAIAIILEKFGIDESEVAEFTKSLPEESS